MNKTTVAISSLLILACCSAPPTKREIRTGTGDSKAKQGKQDQGLSAENKQRLAEANKLFGEKKYIEALDLTDAVLKAEPKAHDARLLAARANLALIDERPKQTNMWLTDAASNLEQALHVTPDDADTWLLLADTQLKRSKFKEGRAAALRAAAVLTASGASKKKVGEAVLQAADNEMQIFVELRREEMAKAEQGVSEEAQTAASRVLSYLEKAKALGAVGGSYARAATVYQWIKQPLEAIRQLERGIAAEPEHFALHTRFRDLHLSQEMQPELVATYKTMVRNHGEQPGLLWGLGIAQLHLAYKKRNGREFDAAVSAYNDALKSFRNAGSARDAWKSSTDQYQATIHIALANIALERSQNDAAKTHLKQAFAASPRVAQYDEQGQPLVRDSANKTYLGTVNRLGAGISAEKTAQSLEAGLAYWEEFIALHPNRFGWIYNNAALCARDLGSFVDREAKKTTGDAQKKAATRAMNLWERSYEHYSKAVDLSPEDARIVNDCGLMLVYHLKRDYGRARKLFDSAIRKGEAQLAALPKDADKDARQNLEEAIGDAYQNIAVMMRSRGKPFADYEELLKKSIRYYPYKGREAQRILRSGEGGGNSANKPDPRPALFAKVKTDTKEPFDKKDFDGVLLSLDAVKKRLKGHAPFHHYAGLCSLLYAKKAMTKKGSATQIDGLLSEARHHLQEAVQLNGAPCAPRLHLAEAYYQSQDYATAAKVADSLLSHIASIGGTSQELHAAALAVRGKIATRAFIRDKQKNQTNEAELNAGRLAFRALEKRERLGDDLATTWARLEEWAGDKQTALAIGVRTTKKAVDALASRNSAKDLWFLGKARFNHAMALNKAGKPADAAAMLSEARQAFDQAMRKKVEFKDTSETWIAICAAERGFLLLGLGKSREAQTAFLDSARLRPARSSTALSNGKTLVDGILAVARPHIEKQDWGKAKAVLQAACDALPEDTALQAAAKPVLSKEDK